MTSNKQYYYSKSKRFAIAMFIAGFILSLYAIHEGMGDTASAIFLASSVSSAGLYGNKQIQDRKKMEIETKIKEIQNEA